MKNFLFTGTEDAWRFSFSHPVIPWGFNPNCEKWFTHMNNGDIAWFYVNNPVSGIVGCGFIVDKYRDDYTRFWADEKKEGKVKYPLRVRLQLIKAINPKDWNKIKVNIHDLRYFKNSGLQILGSENVIKISQRFTELIGDNISVNDIEGANVTSSIVADKINTDYKQQLAIPKHKQIQTLVANVGSIQNYYTELEYPINLENERKSLDVIWKREIAGVPTFAFEVELSGQIEKAIVRLKYAYDNWNSKSVLIVPNEIHEKLKNLISLQDKNFKEQIRYFNPEQITELHKKKIAYREYEKSLGLY